MSGIRFTAIESDPELSSARGTVDGASMPAGQKLTWRASAWDAMHGHIASDIHEVAGVLRGRVRRDNAGRLNVIVDQAVPALGAVTSGTHVSFTPATWDEIQAIRPVEGGGVTLVGWYHSHPGLSAFFSGTDRTTQRDVFRQPWQFGIVIDPLRQESALFLGPDCVSASTTCIEVVKDARVRRPESQPRRFWIGRLPARRLAGVAAVVLLVGVASAARATAGRSVARRDRERTSR